MEFDPDNGGAIEFALSLARRYGGAVAALREMGLDLGDAEPAAQDPGSLERFLAARRPGASVQEALALGFLAGQVAGRAPARRLRDASSFLMDHDLHVQAAHGEAILRLPWFDDGLFVGRALPEIGEMPTPVRRLCVEHYRAALAGDRGRFEFTSYGHTYAVEAVPVRGHDDRIEAVLAVATRTASASPAAAAYRETAAFFRRAATRAEQNAERYRRAGRPDAELQEREAARKAREAAERAGAQLPAGDGAAAAAEPASLTPRETEVLLLASHGLTQSEIARHLVVSVATVRTHFENIYARLGVHDKAGAVAAALRHGLIP
jgi:DNA-binding NarL/FixJ family response regulator